MQTKDAFILGAAGLLAGGCGMTDSESATANASTEVETKNTQTFIGSGIPDTCKSLANCPDNPFPVEPIVYSEISLQALACIQMFQDQVGAETIDPVAAEQAEDARSCLQLFRETLLNQTADAE